MTKILLAAAATLAIAAATTTTASAGGYGYGHSYTTYDAGYTADNCPPDYNTYVAPTPYTYVAPKQHYDTYDTYSTYHAPKRHSYNTSYSYGGYGY